MKASDSPTPHRSDSIAQAKLLPDPLQCLGGSGIAGAIAFGGYSLTIAIAHTFASKPLHTDNTLALKLSAAVRTLVVGIGALGTGIFGIAALGLFLLMIQVSIQRLTQKTNTNE
jgi:hypothetical protein